MALAGIYGDALNKYYPNTKYPRAYVEGANRVTTHHKPTYTPTFKPTHTNITPAPTFKNTHTPVSSAVNTSPVAKTPTVPTGGYTGGGVSGGYTATAPASVKMPQMPSINTTSSTYQDILAAMDRLYNSYGNLQMQYQPRVFSYDAWDENDPRFMNEAEQRMQYELNSQVPVWAQQRQGINNNYDYARQAAYSEEAQQLAAINQAASAEVGRLANMMANSGMGAGQGALQERFGVDQAFADQATGVSSQYGLARAQAALEKANALGEVGANEASFRAALPGQVRDYAQQLEQAAYDRYGNERGFAFGNFQDSEDRRYQASVDAYQSALNALNNQSGLLGQRATMYQDWRDYVAAQQWNLYNAAYDSYIDNRNYDYQAYLDAISNEQWDKQFAANLDAQNVVDERYAEYLRSIGINPDGNGY